jgi:hypothetical protein
MKVAAVVELVVGVFLDVVVMAQIPKLNLSAFPGPRERRRCM